MSIAAISRFVLRHKLLVASFWLVVTIVAVGAAGPASGALSDTFDLPGSESTVTNQAIARTYGNAGSAAPLVAVVTLPAGTTVESAGVRQQLAAAFAKVAAAAPDARIVSYASTGDRLFVSKDGRTTFGLIYPRAAGVGSSPDAPAVKAALHGVTVAGAHFEVTGFNELQSGGGGGGTGVLAESLVGRLGALVVLAWVFGSFLALLPLLMAAIAILTTFLVVWGLTSVTEINTVVQFLIALIGLGVAIDYSLLVVTRWREERAAGRDNTAAVQRAMETAGHSVVFSGTAVAIGLLALVAVPVPYLRSMGYAGLLIPLISVLVTITLLPVVLATIGPRLDWPRLRRGTQVSHFWERWARFVVSRRWLAAALALAILAALVVPTFSLQEGQPSADSLAQSGEARNGLVALEHGGFTAGVLTPFEVLVQQGGDPGAAATTLGRVAGVQGAVAPMGSDWRRGGTALVVAIPTADGNSGAGRAILGRLREAAHALPGQVRIGGAAALQADFIHAVHRNFPLMLALVGLITFALLVRAFRSLVLPLKAVLLNALSIAAAFGILVLVWQEGHGSQLIWGIAPTGAITLGEPLLIFSFLFGLSMDYEVFILSWIREEYDATGSTDRAVVRGIAHTGRLVTSAALILFLAFTALASAPGTSTKIMATGLAAGILLDATVVRALLVPAVVSLMGHWNWWLPAWLHCVVPRQPLAAAYWPAPADEREPASVGSRTDGRIGQDVAGRH